MERAALQKLIAERLAGEMAEHTNRSAARQLGLDASTTSRIRNGSRSPTLMQLRDICTWLGVSSDYLLGLTDDPGRSRCEHDDEPVVRVARLATWETATASPDLPAGPIDAMVPYLARDLTALLGERLDNPDRLILIPEAASSYLLVDRGFHERHVLSHETFVVWSRGQILVCEIDVGERLIRCCTRCGRRFAISHGKQGLISPYLLGRVLIEHHYCLPAAPTR
jgi:transcriptional regulator with XRE-family HTH domain